MNLNSDSNCSDDGDLASTDEAIRQAIAHLPTQVTPVNLEARVLAKVHHRRQRIRATLVALPAVVVTGLAVFFLSLNPRDTPRMTEGQTHSTAPGFTLEDLDLDLPTAEFLVAEPPVMALEVIEENQFAMFDSLANLKPTFNQPPQ